jgi:ABC-type Mn2+/Zn2+ transport system ATPase subunit
MEIAIWTKNLSKTFGSTEALVDLDPEVPAGEVIGYLGPNGAGKTTTIRLLLGLIGATRGRAEVFGIDCPGRPRAGASPDRVRAGRGEPVAIAHRHRDAPPARPGAGDGGHPRATARSSSS